MKYLLVAFILVGCSPPAGFEREARSFCSCHDGLAVLQYNEDTYNITCKDDSKAWGQMTPFTHIISGCQ